MWFKRSKVIDKEELEIRKFFGDKSDVDLRAVQAQTVPHCKKHTVISQMLYERDFWKQFWAGSGAAAWISLIISVISLVLAAIAIYISFKKHIGQ
jgi:hypothetical protein